MRTALALILIYFSWPSLVWAQRAINMQSHLAVYDLALKGSREGSNIVAVKGRLVLEMTDSCDGYAQTQRMLLKIINADGGEILSDSNYTTWESSDGTLIRFNAKNEINGQITDWYSGRAELEGTGEAGRIAFAKPDIEDVDLDAGTIFPTEHYLALIQAGLVGEERLTRRVYDGSGPESIYDAVAFLSFLDSDSNESELLRGLDSWRVRIAYYLPSDESGLPEYEVGFRLYQNGVASEVVLDYGDFQLSAPLSNLEYFESGC